MKTIGILYNPRIAQAHPLALEVAAWIEQRGWRAQVCATDDALRSTLLASPILLMTLGGDGSILRAARAAALTAPTAAVGPILGINLGRVGFLTEADPETWQDVLSRALAGDYWVEERMMLRATAYGYRHSDGALSARNSEPLGQSEALNDVVVGRGARARVVHLRVEVDGGYLATYIADGLIVATPTGSTAYALAAGGPILPPQLRNILLVPIAPHLSMARPIVLSEGVTVRITVTGGRPAVLTVDGEIQAELESGDKVVVKASPHVTRFARVQERTYFYKTLVARLVPQNEG